MQQAPATLWRQARSVWSIWFLCVALVPDNWSSTAQCRGTDAGGQAAGAERADSASYQVALINELEADQVRWAITADQDVAVKVVIAGLPPGAWQEPEPGEMLTR